MNTTDKNFDLQTSIIFRILNRFQLTNTGSVGLSYKWKIVLDDYRDSPTDHSEHSSPSSARHPVTGDGEIRLNSVESGNSFQHIGILSLEFHVDKLSRPLL